MGFWCILEDWIVMFDGKDNRKKIDPGIGLSSQRTAQITSDTQNCLKIFSLSLLAFLGQNILWRCMSSYISSAEPSPVTPVCSSPAFLGIKYLLVEGWPVAMYVSKKKNMTMTSSTCIPSWVGGLYSVCSQYGWVGQSSVPAADV